MGSTLVRASTPDGTAGLPFASAKNEDTPTANLQMIVAVGNKETYTEGSRTGLTAIDAPTGGDLTTTGFAGTAGANLIDLANGQTCHVRGTCNTAGGTISGRLIFYNSSFAPTGMSDVINLAADIATFGRRLGNASGDFIANRVAIDALGARYCRFFVESITNTWAIYVRPI